jgi:uncharacterized protein YndB with AHSA1/START domain
MDSRSESEAKAVNNPTEAERTSDRELVVTRTFDAPARMVWEGWTRPELFRRWWIPKSFPVTLLSCEQDIRIGGKYRLLFGQGDGEPKAFFGTYLEVEPQARLVWTNDEGGDQVITTVTFEEKGGKTRVVLHDMYPSKEALDEAISSGSTSGGMTEQFDQLAELLVTLAAA